MLYSGPRGAKQNPGNALSYMELARERGWTREAPFVVLDRPQTSPWASDTAAWSFQRLTERLFVVLGVPPSGVQVAEATQ